ncbi:hypothetical protein B7P43_G07718 [Cryptotermes secundus]|uniref:Uncharacterized protein n=1 Tax=Cryptotermes secundus TaxID=105785 RepID=A0A2J7Q4I3_9NEOP|nr:hypothetical protein B7P43_G07718 [Cryptotermes secundus]
MPSVLPLAPTSQPFCGLKCQPAVMAGCDTRRTKRKKVIYVEYEKRVKREEIQDFCDV